MKRMYMKNFIRDPYLRENLRENFRRALPIILGHAMISLLGVVDTAVAGRMPEVEYLAAIGLGSAFVHFVFWLFGFLRMGTTGVTAQALGMKDSRGVRLSLLRGAGLGFVLGIVMLIFSPLLHLLALEIYVDDKSLAAPFLDYLRVRFLGAPFALSTYALYGWFLGVDRNPLLLLIQTLVITANIILSPALAFGLGLGVEGIAWATVISEILGFVLSLIFVVRTLSGRSLGIGDLVSPLRLGDLLAVVEIRRFLSINAHIFMRTLFMLLSFQLFWILSADLGVVELSVNTILLQLLYVAAFALDGFALAGEAMVGENFARYGKGSRASYVVERVVVAMFVWSFLFALLFVIIYGIAYDLLIAGFTDLESLRARASLYRWWAVFIPLVGVWGYVWDGVFLGLTLTRDFMLGMLISSLGFVLCALPLTAFFGNSGLWISLYIFFALRALSLYVFWRRWLSSRRAC